MVRWVQAPAYTDAHYHTNAATRVAAGQGLTELYLWTYLGAPDALPASGVFPSHLYWMPLTSLIAGAGMRVFGIDYAGAQTPNVLLVAIMAGIGYWLGWRLGGSRRHAWMAGLITLSGGFFARYWGVIDTFAPYAVAGAGCLALMGLGSTTPQAQINAHDAEMHRRARIQPWVWWMAGIGAGLGHLTRADGLLLLLVGVWVIVGKREKHNAHARRRQGTTLLCLLAGYLLVMGGWFARNLHEVGVILPTGGVGAIWYRSYDDLFRYPPVNTPDMAFSDGGRAWLSARWEALSNNLATFVAVEGMIVLTPLMLIGLLVRRHDPFLRPFLWYVFGLHIVFTLVFPFPGYRGGLLHSAVALLPCWAALGVVGLDDVIGWFGKRRRWNTRAARSVFSTALLVYVVGLSLWIGTRGRVETGDPPVLYTRLEALLPDDARVMINDPAALYGYTGLGGVVVPNEAPHVIAVVAARYAIQYVVIEPAGVPARMRSILEDPPSFLREIGRIGDAVVYALDE
jgi:4-amino-4-deoxy-L-arabinose transferase-like glycosyltransferase